ncbi:hypothetical protein PVK06_001114 [Gossypium arboreum]|uniref:RNase H type-1 domain-containing protein n=1 Tax=Gossypium arboreum TaxID=29729 RepID=A0ABR0R1D1_GOSAR|nr:hypothetical protein PVK06_001114 [Gossypium arboreum]
MPCNSLTVLFWSKASFTNNVVISKWAELDALIEGFQLVQLLNVDKVIFETVVLEFSIASIITRRTSRF